MKSKIWKLLLCLALVVSVTACEALELDDTDNDASAEVVGGGIDTSEWRPSSHQCLGNRTDALHRDSDGTLYIGCGSNSDGDLGLLVSTDDGATWSKPTTDPPAFLNDWRVLDVSRSDNGRLYIAGRRTSRGGQRVVSVDTSSSIWSLEDEYNAGEVPNTVNIGDVGGFRRDSTGRAIAHSSTGAGIAFREADDEEYINAEGFVDDDSSRQIQGLSLIGDRFVAGGGSIGSSPAIYIEDTSAAEFTMNITELAASGASAFDGEIQSIAVTLDEIVGGGYNNDESAGVIYIIALDDPSDRSLFNVRSIYPDDTTWIRGVCRDGETIVAVGEFSSLSKGLILVSLDGGETWTSNIPTTSDSSYKLPPVQRCLVTEDTIFVAGGGGTFLRRDRPSAP